MIDGSSLQSFRVNIINADSIRLGTEWNFTDVYGPYHRLFLIKDGEGLIRHHHQDFHLVPGVLGLVPAFTRSSYHCHSFIEQDYLYFACELEGHLDFFTEMSFQYQVPACELDRALFSRLLELNPGMGMPEIDPQKYNKKQQLDRSQNYCNEVSPAVFIESKSIVLQLVSRFLIPPKEKPLSQREDYGRIKDAVSYLWENIDQELTVAQLADIAYLSPDYFSKLFKKTMGVRPIEYIHRRRLQRVKLLLLTTNMSVEQIARSTGFSSVRYLLRVFRKYTGRTMTAYRKASQYS